MFKLLVEKELRETVLTTKFASTFGICSLLILISFYVGASHHLVSQAEYEAATAENLKQMEGLTDWGRISHRIFLPPQPLGALVSGISNDIGRTTEMRAQGELRSEDSRFNEDPIFAVFRFLDLEFLFSIVLSLFAILFAYDEVNGEKERGTLRLSFSSPIPRDTYILGKLVGAFVALGIALVVPILLGSLLLPILGVPMTGESWGHLSLIIVAGYLYLGVFLCLSVFVSAMTERSSSSFLLILVVWIITVMIVPRAAVMVAGRAVDVPSIDKVNFEKRQYRAQLWQEDVKDLAEWQKQNPPSGESMQDWMREFQAFISERGQIRSDNMSEFAGRINEERSNRESVQQKLALGIARVSPTSVFSLVAAQLAGTSLELEHRYRESANRYQEQFAQFRQEKTGDAPGVMFRIGTEEEEEPEPIDPHELPVFEFQRPSAAETVSGSLLDLGLLIGFNVLFFAGAFVAFLRYDVR